MSREPTCKNQSQRARENADLRARLDKAEETLRAIRASAVDALVVSTAQGERIFTLKGAVHPYRVLIEDMNQGALTLTLDGAILYANQRFAEMLKTPLEQVIGSTIHAWVAPDSQPALQAILRREDPQTRRRGEVALLAGDGSRVPSFFSANVLQMEEMPGLFCLVATDLTEQKRTEGIGAAEKSARPGLEESEQTRLVLLSMLEDQQRAEEALRARVATLQALAEIDREIVAANDAGTILELVCRHAAELLHAPKAAIATMDESSTMRMRASFGLADAAAVQSEFMRQWRAGMFPARQGGIVALNEIPADPPFMPEFRARENIRAMVIVPLLMESARRGALLVFDTRLREWSGNDVNTLGLLAGQTCVTLEKVRLHTETERRAEQLAHANQLMSALSQATTNIGQILKPQEIMETVGTGLRQLGLGCVITLLEPDRQALVIRYASVTSRALERLEQLFQFSPIGFRLPRERWLVPQVVDANKPAFHPNWGALAHSYLPHLPEAIVHRGMRLVGVSPETRFISVPLLAGNITLGELSAWGKDLQETDLPAFAVFAGQVAAALENARLFEETRQRLAELEAVNRISTALRAAQTLDEMLPRLLDETLAVLDTDAGVIFFYDTSHDQLNKAVARGWYTQMPDTPLKPSECVAGQAILTGEAYLSREFTRDPRLRDLLSPVIPAGWGGAGAPIRAAQEIIGVICVAVQLPREFAQQQVRLLTTLAEIVGNAIQRTRLHEQTVRQVQRLTALHTIDLAVGGSLDLRVTFDVFLSETVARLNADAAAILLLNPYTQRLEYTAARGFRGQSIKQFSVRLGEGLAGRAALERRMVEIRDWRLEVGASSKLQALISNLQAEGFVASLAAPLIAKGQLKGVLELFYRVPFTPDPGWTDFMGTLAGEAALAIDNAQLFEQSQRLTADLSLAYDATIEGWSRALDLRDKETEGHTQRVVGMTLQLARAFGLREEQLVHVRRGALLHDIGKMGVPDGILLKPGKLTDEEWVLMRRHPQLAYEMLAPIEYLKPALDIPYCHHEKWDGTGYPRGLKGEQIPLAARLFAVVDVWDALRSDRPYRPAWSEEETRAHIRAGAGTHFDPRVVEAFARLTEAP